MSKYISILVLTIFCVGCNSTNSDDQLKDVLHKVGMEQSDHLDAVILIPDFSCQSCLQEQVSAIKKKVAKEKCLFLIVTKSNKGFLSLKDDLQLHDFQVIQDKQLLAIDSGLIANDLKVFIRNKGQWIDDTDNMIFSSHD
ncbi:MAG: hypothetical protein LAT68_06090 [Cyclobacteriaceae bacterium]|nr:hypothetical protein [Cyclobacteriaceae bacterium]MCH8515881.1 hypothetical protein [Cyclobacteriaceae bacterium]